MKRNLRTNTPDTTVATSLDGRHLLLVPNPNLPLSLSLLITALLHLQLSLHPALPSKLCLLGNLRLSPLSLPSASDLHLDCVGGGRDHQPGVKERLGRVECRDDGFAALDFGEELLGEELLGECGGGRREGGSGGEVRVGGDGVREEWGLLGLDVDGMEVAGSAPIWAV